jgi:hypothetical protein
VRERISLRSISHAVGVSLTWLLRFIGECLAAYPDGLHGRLPPRPTDVVLRRLEAEADKMWGFQYDAYPGVIPAERHQAITKQARKTNYIERFNNTLRQRVSRLVRETLSFSKKLAYHIGAIKYCIGYYHCTSATATALPV